MIGALRQGLRAILDAFYPPHCVICGDSFPSGGEWICAACEESLPRLPDARCGVCDLPDNGEGGRCPDCGAPAVTTPYRKIRTALYYQGAARELLVRFKYQGRTELSNFFVERLRAPLVECVRSTEGSALLVVPVPPDRVRLRQRGFHPPALLARKIARLMDWPYDPMMLVRVGKSIPQVGLDRGRREKNVREAFRVARQEIAAGKDILLVDDLVTTTSTVRACAAQLREAGARSVVAIAVARASLGGEGDRP